MATRQHHARKSKTSSPPVERPTTQAQLRSVPADTPFELDDDQEAPRLAIPGPWREDDDEE